VVLPDALSRKVPEAAADRRRVGQRTLAEYMEGLTRATPVLRANACLGVLLSRDLDNVRGKDLKVHEDRLDALFCAYLAYYFWFWRRRATKSSETSKTAILPIRGCIPEEFSATLPNTRCTRRPRAIVSGRA
jgi:predicted RNase H-like nuclease